MTKVRKQEAGRYGLLLVFLITAYLLSAFTSRKVASDVQIGLIAVILVLALRTSPLPGWWPVLIGMAALAGSAAAIIVDLTWPPLGTGVADLWRALMLLLTATLIVRRVLARPTVTLQSLYGALSAYLVVGLMFAACYAAMQQLSQHAFFADGQPGTTQTFQYFSFTTLTTLGYGDFTAAGNSGRAIAVLEAMTGQVFLATLVARLVSVYRSPAGQDDSPAGQDDSPPSRRVPPRSVRRRPRTRAYSRSRLSRPLRATSRPGQVSREEAAVSRPGPAG